MSTRTAQLLVWLLPKPAGSGGREASSTFPLAMIGRSRGSRARRENKGNFAMLAKGFGTKGFYINRHFRLASCLAVQYCTVSATTASLSSLFPRLAASRAEPDPVISVLEWHQVLSSFSFLVSPFCPFPPFPPSPPETASPPFSLCRPAAASRHSDKRRERP